MIDNRFTIFEVRGSTGLGFRVYKFKQPIGPLYPTRAEAMEVAEGFLDDLRYDAEREAE